MYWYDKAVSVGGAVVCPIQSERMTTDQVYRLYLLRSQVHLGVEEQQEAVVDLHSSMSQGEVLSDEYAAYARNKMRNEQRLVGFDASATR